MDTDQDFPEWLTNFDLLQQHVRGQLEGLNNTEKGTRFAHFVKRLIPQSEVGSTFSAPELSGKVSNDGGVDLTAQSGISDKVLYIQSKLWVDRADKIDSVISKFEAFTTKATGQFSMFDSNDPAHYMLVTLSPLSKILEHYNKKQYSSKSFYQRCVEENRVHFIDGPEIFNLLRNAHSKLHQIPVNLTINFEASYLKKDNVYVGIVASDELTRLYKQFGDALFFENIRDFLGIQTQPTKMGRTSPNLEIIKTIQDAPEKMLSRNNGLVFGAENVLPGKTENQLKLTNGSVVNGCQTTTCLVRYSEKPCYVLVKVVQTQHAWDITKSANYQTSVPDIDLELARYIRPQLVKRAAANFGVQLQDVERSAFQLIDEIYDRKVAYSETRLLYIGLFSRTPNNVFGANYTELWQELIIELYKNGLQEEDVFEILFVLQGNAHESLKKSQEIFSHPSYAGMFDRLYKDNSLSYRCLLSILALCGLVNINISERASDIEAEQKRVRAFLDKARLALKDESERFSRFYNLAVKMWMQEMLTDSSDSEIARDMHVSSRRLNFTNLYRKLCMEADLDPVLNERNEMAAG